MTGPEPVPRQAITLKRRTLPDSLRYLAGKLTDGSTDPLSVSLVLLTLAGEQENVAAAERERCAQLAEQEAASGQKLGLTRIALRAFAERLRQGGEGGGT